MKYKVGDLVEIVNITDEAYFLRRKASKGDVFTVKDFYDEGTYYIIINDGFSVSEIEIRLCIPNNPLARAVYPNKVPHPKHPEYLVDK